MIHIDKNRFGPWVIVTGASSGIGAEFARQLAANKLNVVLVARRLERLQALGNELAQRHGIQYKAVRADLSTPDFMDDIEPVTRDLDIGLVVSNAGTGRPGAFLLHEHTDLIEIVRLNALSHLTLVHHFGQRLAARRRGGFILVAAMGAQDGLPYMANDAASKSYVISLGQGLHVEFEKLGLNMTVLMPGPTETPIIEQFGFNPATMAVKPMPVEQCVEEGLEALNANRALHLTGRLNRLMDALVPASITRKMLGNMIANGTAAQRLQADNA